AAFADAGARLRTLRAGERHRCEPRGAGRLRPHLRLCRRRGPAGEARASDRAPGAGEGVRPRRTGAHAPAVFLGRGGGSARKHLSGAGRAQSAGRGLLRMLITRTPLRISFAGGGSDFRGYYARHGGAVLSTAIDKYIHVILQARFDEKIRVGYSRTELVDTIEELQHELVREAMRRVGVERGVEISTMADVPSTGTGLGSSSSVTVGLL